jgi:hypothetical protein
MLLPADPAVQRRSIPSGSGSNRSRPVSVMPLSGASLAECKRITEILLKSPGCAVFRNPVDPVRDGIPDYYKIIKQPRDLTTIRRHLDIGIYRSVEEWEADIDLIWANAEKFNGTGSMIHLVAKSMAAKCAKLKKNLKVTLPRDWVTLVTQNFERLTDRLKSAPGFLKPHFGEEKFSGPVNSAELQRFCTASGQLTNRADILQLIQLMALFGVNFDFKKGDATVPVKSLPPEALSTLISFLKDRFRAMKIVYPV